MMIKKVISFFLTLICATTVWAQEPFNPDLKTVKTNNWAIGGLASTNGLGGNIIFSINNKLDVRGGFEKLNFNYDFGFREDDIDYNATLDYKAGSFSVLADYYLFRFLYVTGGLGLNFFNPNIQGYAISDMKYGDIYIPKEKIGGFEFEAEPNLKISPYAGMGLGRTIGLEKKVAFNLEFGAFYMGVPDVTIKATGLLLPTADPAHGQKQLFENQLKTYRVYPVIRFGVSVKLF